MFFFEGYGVEEKEIFLVTKLTVEKYPSHFHRAYELIIVNEGLLKVIIDQKKYNLHKNEMAFVFSNQLHEFCEMKNADVSIVLFSPELIGDFYMEFKGNIPVNNCLKLKKTYDLNKLNTIYKQKSFLYEICSLLVDSTDFNSIKKSEKSKVLQQILLYIDNNYDHVCFLKDVAYDLKYDYAYLSKLFVQFTGMTFTEYLNKYRIFKAIYLLQNSNKKIGEIAYDCGYNNLRTFHRNFKKIVGQSPSNIRSQKFKF